jgi:hypothetical protein
VCSLTTAYDKQEAVKLRHEIYSVLSIQRILVDSLDKATKSVRWMTRFKMPMKDVENNEMLWRAVPSRDPQVSEWGNPLTVMGKYLALNS